MSGVNQNLTTGDDSWPGAGDNNALNDSINGLAGNDTIDGGNGDDTLLGEDGHDSLVGGNGSDWTSYTNLTSSFSSVTVNLATGRATGSGNDSLAGIENVLGGGGSDSILGDSLNNILDGGSGSSADTLDGANGNDTLIGGGGSDSLVGGNGTDLVSYASVTFAGTAITVNLATNRATLLGENDSLSGIENVLGGAGNDTILGDSLANLLDGAAGDDTLDGGAGDDSVEGGAGNDSLIGGDSGLDTLSGGANNDTIIGSFSINNRLFGGTGDDSVRSSTGPATIWGEEGNDTAYGIAGFIDGGSGDDSIQSFFGTAMGGAGNDTLISTSLNESLNGGDDFDIVSYAGINSAITVNLTAAGGFQTTGGGGNDTLINIEGVIGGTGNDSILGDTLANILNGGDGNDTLDGGDGADRINTGQGINLVYGGNGADVITAVGQNTIYGGAGNDAISIQQNTGSSYFDGGGENDFFQRVLASGNDTFIGGDGDDTVFAGGAFGGSFGHDSIVGGDGNDVVDYFWVIASNFTATVSVNLSSAAQTTGGGGNDTLVSIEGVFGSANSDTLIGDGNNNTLMGRGGNDSLVGGVGNDWVLYSEAGGDVTVNLNDGRATGADGNDTLVSIENVLGGNGNDSILGDSLANILNGGAGNDTLSGGVGNDTIDGGAGSDTLDGGSGNDFASYANATGTIYASLSDDTAAGGVAEGADGSDRLFGIEGLIGGNSDDTLIGNSASNTLMGGDGSDSLFGGGGNDWLDFGNGADRFDWVQNVTTGNLTLIGGDAGGNDTLNLGTGWVSGPVASGFINFQRIDGSATVYSQGWESIVCFAEGTRIVTPSGEDVVENLRAGDMVLAMRGGQAGFEPLRWVGSMDVAVPRNATMAAKTAPILIKAGAIAPGMPARDLRVSPDHAMEIDGHLIPAKHLVNGSSIIQEIWCRRVRYFHLELEAHGLLLSEGTWSESYLDDGNRHAFNNAALTGLFLDFEAGRSKGQYDHLACLPVLRQGLKLDEIHGRLALRADVLPRAGTARHTP